ncbi:hypothetical protein [Streptomyces sp. NPDC059979]|uniref:hypothetical protein n=1 Tax=Streptomyces sp. NPDC059979 TaxID=3347021 RepID=UPI0036B69CE7
MPTEPLPEDPAAWNDSEQQLRADALARQETILGYGDPSSGGSWGPDRTIRADAVRRLLTENGEIIRLCLKGARIEGKLDFEATHLNGTLELTGCHVSEVINFEQATAPAIYLDNCHLAGLEASEVHTLHGLTLAGTTCRFLDLGGAQIDGQFNLEGAELTGCAEMKYTLDLNGSSVSSDAFLENVKITGPANLMGARISGQLNMRGATLIRRGGRALKALALDTKEDVIFDNGFKSEGAVDLTGSVIGGNLRLDGAAIHHSGKRPALDLARVKIKQNMRCQNGCTVEGRVLLVGASIAGNLLASGGQFIHPSDTAIDATGLEVRDLVLGREPSDHEADRSRFRAQGKVVLADAVITGTLDCRGGSISNPEPEQEAFNARGMKVTRDMLLSDGFSVVGKVVLVGAEVGGRAVLADGSFENAGREAISARQFTVRTSLLLSGRFLARGMVDLSGATVSGRLVVGGQIYCPEKEALVLDRVSAAQDVVFQPNLLVEGSLCMRAASVGSNLEFDNPNLSRGQAGLALNLFGTSIAGTLTLKADPTTLLNGRVDLRQAKARFLQDSPHFWPERNTLLAGFAYEALSDFESPSIDERINLLCDGYSAQTYEHLAAVYQVSGRDDFARKVRYEGQKRRPRPRVFENIWSWLLRLTVGYGYHPARVLYVVLLLEIFGWIYFSISRDDLRPSSALVNTYGGDRDIAARHLQPALYTLDLLLPLVSFGQRALWIPQGVTSWVVTLLMVAGWVLGGILVYGIGTAYQRRSS